VCVREREREREGGERQRQRGGAYPGNKSDRCMKKQVESYGAHRESEFIFSGC
jgi:hypothetical protein